VECKTPVVIILGFTEFCLKYCGIASLYLNLALIKSYGDKKKKKRETQEISISDSPVYVPY